MNLVEAFEAFGPPGEDPSPAALERLARAGRRLLEQCERASGPIANRQRASSAAVDDAVQSFLLRLFQGGPRASRAGRTEASVRGYLARGIENELRSWRRGAYERRRRPLGDDAGDDDAGPAGARAIAEDRAAPGGERDLGGSWTGARGADGGNAGEDIGEDASEHAGGGGGHEALAALRARLLGPVLEQALAGTRGALARAAFQAHLDELLALAEGRLRWSELLAARAATGDCVAPNTVHQHHTRARRRLLRSIQELADDGELAPEDADGLRRFVEATKRGG